MKSISSVSGIRKCVANARAASQKVALVPTMGALHEGHLRLVDLARKRADFVVMSIYVNPSQFGPKEDFSKYPRPLAADKAMAAARGVDVIFNPQSLYAKDDSVSVSEKELSLGRCGQSRPGHFDGVVTVVSKLFNILQPDFAVFGQKDGQQLDVIERLVRDLYFPIKILRAPIVRDEYGLALSSRNRYLTPAEYAKALAFAEALKVTSRVEHEHAVAQLKRKLADISGLEVDYVTEAGGRLFAAVQIGKTRLIDNRKITQPR